MVPPEYIRFAVVCVLACHDLRSTVISMNKYMCSVLNSSITIWLHMDWPKTQRSETNITLKEDRIFVLSFSM